MRKKKKRVFVLSIFTALLLLMGTVYAWFTTSDQVTNVMKMGSLDVSLSTAFQNITISPGLELEKRVSVTNKGSSPALIRIRLEESFEQLAFDEETGKPLISYGSAKGVPPTGVNRPFEWLLDPEVMQNISIDTVHWRLATGGPADLTIYEQYQVESEPTSDSYIAFVTATGQVVKVVPMGLNGLADDQFQYAYHSYVHPAGANNIVYGGGTPFNSSNIMDSNGIRISQSIQMMFDESKITTDRMMLSGKQWFYNTNDHSFYYLKPLLSGETVSLLDSLKFSPTMDNRYQGATYSLTPKMEAVQYDTSVGESQPAAQALWQSTLGINFSNILTQWDKN